MSTQATLLPETPAEARAGAVLCSSVLLAADLDWKQIKDPVERKKARLRQWMRSKRKATPKQYDAHVRARSLSIRMARQWEKRILTPNGHKHTPESRAKLSAANTGKKHNVSKEHREWSRQHAISMLPKLHTETVRRKISASAKRSAKVAGALKMARAAAKESPKCQRAETNACAQELWLKSPSGKSYHAINAQHFVRTHKHLFNELDTVERMPTGVSRAAHGLRNLNPKIKSGYPVWKHWMWDYESTAEAANP